MRIRLSSLLPLALAVAPLAASAQTITNGFTFAIASDGTCNGVGTHFHSNTGGSFGNPAGKAEVGSYVGECVRGLSEYNLAGLSTSPTAFVTFNVFKAGGLFAGSNDFPFSGTINVVAYAGNNAEDLSDYQATSLGTVGSFSTAGLAVGSVLSFNITSLFNAAVTGGRTSFGIRLQRASESVGNSGGYTFDTFRLTSDNQTTSVTPEPGTYLLLATGLGVFGFVARRRSSPAA